MYFLCTSSKVKVQYNVLPLYQFQGTRLVQCTSSVLVLGYRISTMYFLCTSSRVQDQYSNGKGCLTLNYSKTAKVFNKFNRYFNSSANNFQYPLLNLQVSISTPGLASFNIHSWTYKLQYPLPTSKFQYPLLDFQVLISTPELTSFNIHS